MTLYLDPVLDRLALTWSDAEPWLNPLVEKIFLHYKELRKDILLNTNNWSYSDYCERLAFHYYHLALIYYELFHEYRLDLESVDRCLKKCLQQVDEVPKHYSSRLASLECDANNMLKVVMDVFDHIGKQSCSNKDRCEHVKRYTVAENNPWCQQIHVIITNFNEKMSEQQIRSIQLTRVINALEEAVAIPHNGDKCGIADLAASLGIAYQLAGHPILTRLYINTAKHLYESSLKDDTCPYLEKQVVDRIIENNIVNFELNLEQVKAVIISEANVMSLSSTDCAYIEEKYGEYCLEYCLNAIKTFLVQLEESKRGFNIQELCHSIGAMKELSQIPSPLIQQSFCQLLLEHQDFVKTESLRAFIGDLKTVCYEHAVTYIESARKELTFLMAIVNFVGGLKNNRSLVNDLKLRQFCDGKFPIKYVIEQVMCLKNTYNDGMLQVLKESATALNDEKDLFFLDMFKEILATLIQNVDVSLTVTNGTSVIVIKGKHIVVSEVLWQVEDTISHDSTVNEVHFIGDDVYIDASLEDKCIWHGKNIVVMAKKIIVDGMISWNVSGKDNDHVYLQAANDGNGQGENGENGKDGHAGESGGNVMILTEIIENSQDLTIISVGGNGSNGQDGGNGTNGADGTGITAAELNKIFPVHGIEGTKKKVLSLNVDTAESIGRLTTSTDPINILTKDGNKITYYDGNRVRYYEYFDCGNVISYHYLFMIYGGSFGKTGGNGGEFGKGGEGGYCGDITIKHLGDYNQEWNIVTEVGAGNEGQRGKRGSHGQFGKNGWDVGFVWTNPTSFEPVKVMHGEDRKSKLELVFTDNNITGNGKYIDSRKQYADIKASSNPLRNEHTVGHRQRNDVNHTYERQHHAKATRKKAILVESVLANYSCNVDTLDSVMLKDTHLNLDATYNLALQGIIDNKLQEDKETTEVTVNRFKHFVGGKEKSEEHKLINSETPIKSSFQETDELTACKVISEIKLEPTLTDNWIGLACLELTCPQVDLLFDHEDVLKSEILNKTFRSSKYNETSQTIEQFLIEKYRIGSLKRIAEKVMPVKWGQDSGYIIEIPAEKAAKYLLETEDERAEKSDDGHTTVKEHILQSTREQVISVCEIFKKRQTGDEALDIELLIEMFFKEIHVSGHVIPDLEKHYNKFKDYIEDQERISSSVTKLFNSALKTRSINPKCTSRSIVEERIESEAFVSSIYKDACEQVDLSIPDFEWQDICNDSDTLSAYVRYIEEKGTSSACYIELLANIFDTNIRMYTKHHCAIIQLQTNHNPTAKKSIHVLQEDNQFKELNFDQNFLSLKKDREFRNVLFEKILLQTEQFKLRTDFDNYISEESFLSNGYVLSKEMNSPLNTVSTKQIAEEENIILEISEYFSFPTKTQVMMRLETISSQFIGSQRILYCLWKRFANEGRHVSFEEVGFLVSSVLSSFIEDRNEFNIFCWIISCVSQKYWVGELLVLALENVFRRPIKSTLREYLYKVNNWEVLILLKQKLDVQESRNSISIQDIENILCLLSKTTCQTSHLHGLELDEWMYSLKEQYWICKLKALPLVTSLNQEQVNTCTYYLLTLENTSGCIMVEKFVEILECKTSQLTPGKLVDILHNLYGEKWILSSENMLILSDIEITEWEKTMLYTLSNENQDVDINQLVKSVRTDINTSNQIVEKLPLIMEDATDLSQRGYATTGSTFSTDPACENIITNRKPIRSFTEDDVKEWVANFKVRTKDTPRETRLSSNLREMLAIIDRAIELKRGFKLKDTQKFTILSFLRSERKTLAQVSTGEGKSLVVVVLSIMKALCGEKVDVITSSSVLAKRDASAKPPKGNCDIYHMFDVSVSHNCNEDTETRRAAYSGSQVVYGDISSFQRDYLLDRFYNKNILGDRDFENVIIDEVDSMLLDKGNNMLYLSHDLAGFDKLESVYVYIWQWLNQPVSNLEQFEHCCRTSAIKDAVLDDLYGFLTKKDLERIGSELDTRTVNVLWESLIEAKIIDSRGNILNNILGQPEFKDSILERFPENGNRLLYLLKDRVERERRIHVPEYLKPFIEDHLEAWIDNAKTAFFMKEGHDYVVDVDRTRTKSDIDPNITIIDPDTGTDQANSQWDEGLHQFLQLKHGCKLSLQSLKAVYISNVTYFKQYKNLYGLTGTLGSQRERTLLTEVHGVDFVTVPRARLRKFCEGSPVICANTSQWIKEITERVNTLVNARLRSALIICETVNDVDTLYQAFGGKNASHVHAFKRDYEQFDLTEGNTELKQGQIIVATNLAGRGTDIKISAELEEVGGLHVCLTYLPYNSRIEEQAFGRAARGGDRGSGEMFIVNPDGQLNSSSKVVKLKTERINEELHRVANFKKYYTTEITTQEDCFKEFQSQYKKLRLKLEGSDANDEVKEILLQSILDRWAFWLDRNRKCLNMASLRLFIAELDELQSGSSKDWQAWVSSPFQVTKLAKCLVGYEVNKYAEVIALFYKVIKDVGPLHYSLAVAKLQEYLSLVGVNQHDKYSEAQALLDKVMKDEQLFSEATTKLANSLVRLKRCDKYDEAIGLFDKVIKDEPRFSEAAHYYKAFAIAKKTGLDRDSSSLEKFKCELLNAAKLFEKHGEYSRSAAGIIDSIKKRNHNSVLQIDAFKEQQLSISNLNNMFLQSIFKIIGYGVTPESLVTGDINEEMVDDLYEALLEVGGLKKARVKSNFNEKDLATICNAYGILTENLKLFLEKYPGEEIIEETFRKSLEKHIKLPSREELWEILIKNGILKDEVQFVVINYKTLSAIDPLLKIKLGPKELPKSNLISQDSRYIFLNGENAIKDDQFVLINKEFLTICGPAKYNVLMRKGVFSVNKKASIDKSKLEASTTMPLLYDSIRGQDFIDAGIVESDVKLILRELETQHILTLDESGGRVDVYKLTGDTTNVKLSSCPLYDNAVKALLSVRCVYRIALQALANQVTEERFPLQLRLMSRPHHKLIWDLIDQRIITSVTVNTKSLDGLEKKLKEKFSVPCTLYYQKQLGEDETIKKIVRILSELKSSLDSLDSPSCYLKSLNELINQGPWRNIDEIHMFTLNGLSHFLDLEEKRWTFKMLCSTAAVIFLGICQIAIGVAIEVFSVGIMTHVGGAFIGEGVGDLTFASEALISGHFSWKAYGIHKLWSVATSALTAGVGAYLSRGAKVSQIGYKIAGRTYEIGGKPVAKMCGQELIKNVGKAKIRAVQVSVFRQAVKRVGVKVVQGLAFGVASSGINKILETYVHTLCEGIASSVITNVEECVENHSISNRLECLFITFGKEEANKHVNLIMSNYFSNKNTVYQTIKSYVRSLAGSITNGIANASKKLEQDGQKVNSKRRIISEVIKWAGRIYKLKYLVEIISMTNITLNNMNEEIKSILRNVESVSAPDRADEQLALRCFKEDVVGKLQKLLRTQAEQIIEQHIVTPILNAGVNVLLTYAGQLIKTGLRYYKEHNLQLKFEKLEKEFSDVRRGSAVQSRIEEYHIEVLKLMAKTRNPKLLAKFVREKGPMEMVCLQACAHLLPQVLKRGGVSVPGVTLAAEGEGGERQQFSSEGILTDQHHVVVLPIKDNHFVIRGDDGQGSTSGYDCLYVALTVAFPELSSAMTADQFRLHIADVIEHDPTIRHVIKQGFHQISIAHGMFGGKEKDRKVEDGPIQNGPHYRNDTKKYEEQLRKNKEIVKNKMAVQLSEYCKKVGRNIDATTISDKFDHVIEDAVKKQRISCNYLGKEIDLIENIDGYRSYETRISNTVASQKFTLDHKDQPHEDLLTAFNYVTIAAAIKDDVLYVACNYEKRDRIKYEVETNRPRPKYEKTPGWGSNESCKAIGDFIMDKHLEHIWKPSKIVFLDTKRRPTDTFKPTEYHAEMQLSSYLGSDLLYVGTSKPPCILCSTSLELLGVQYPNLPGKHPGAENWKIAGKENIYEKYTYTPKHNNGT